MPPRYAYWTIIVDDQPTAFRAGAQEDLMPTFKRLQQKHASAKMMWFQNGKLWPSRLDAQEAMRARGEMGRRGDARQDRHPDVGERFSAPDQRPEWKPRGAAPESRPSRPEWKPKGEGARSFDRRTAKPEWKPKGAGERSFDRRPAKPEWRPKAAGARSFDRPAKPEWKPKGAGPRSYARPAKPDWKPKGAGARSFDRPSRKPEWAPKRRDDRSERPEWKPKGEGTAGSREKRKWIPKEEYKKSQGIEAKRDKNWRPGGEHKDPRQKYKDAKKAKWGRFKQTIRKRYESKQGKKKG